MFEPTSELESPYLKIIQFEAEDALVDSVRVINRMKRVIIVMFKILGAMVVRTSETEREGDEVSERERREMREREKRGVR